METGTIILYVVILIFLLIIMYLILLMFQGRKIKIVLDKYDFSPGEKVNGKIVVNKDILEVSSVKVGIDCKLKETNFRKENNSSNNKPIYSFEKPINSSSSLTKGAEIPFEIPIPKDVMNKVENNVAKAAISVLNALSGTHRTYSWSIYARIDKPGLDISNSQKIIVNN